MELKQISAALAAGFLLAGLTLTADTADAGGRPHFSGGGAHLGGMRHFGGMRMGGSHHFSGHVSHNYHSNYRHSNISHNTTHNTSHSVTTNKSTSKSVTTGQKNNFSQQNKFASNKQVHQASVSKHNAFFNKGQFGGKGFGRGWGGDHYRWYGAVFWPWFFGDYFSYAFWPWDYYDVYWGYGPDALVWGAFWPYGEFSYDPAAADESVYEGQIYRPYRQRVQSESAQVNSLATTDTCSGFAPGVSDLPIQQLEKVVDATEEQRSALEELKAATEKAAEFLKQSCSSETPLTPVARLDAMKRRLEAMDKANEAIKGPLEHLYDLFTDEQKQRLEAMSHSSQRPANRSKEMNVTELCSSQAEFTNVPSEQIESTITLTGAQKQELEKLKSASEQASTDLKASCPSAAPTTLNARLDAAQQRVEALLTALNTIRPAVQDFYGSLTDEQKAALSIQAGQQQNANNRG